VKLTKKDGTTIEFVATVQTDQGSMLNHTKVIALEEIRVVQEYPATTQVHGMWTA
jgi:hypothetical protein